MKKIIFTIFLFLVLVTSAHAYTSSGSIYIGDSRVQGMVINGILNESNAVYGSGCGYSWFVGNDACTRIATNSAMVILPPSLFFCNHQPCASHHLPMPSHPSIG